MYPAAGASTIGSSAAGSAGEINSAAGHRCEMGKHGSEAQKSLTTEATLAAVEKHDDAVRETGATAGQGVKDMAARAAGATADYTSTKDTGAQAAAKKTQEATGTAADYTKLAAAKVKDVTAGTAETTMKYAKQAAVKAKDVTLGTGETAMKYAKQAAVKGKDVTKYSAAGHR
jgi:hypothetical protein